MQPFVVNRHGRLVFPSNFQPYLDFSVIDSEDQLDMVIRRDFETKAPKGTDIVNRITAGHYPSRYELMRDVALNLFWVNRFAMTMYDKQPVRWRDVPRTRQDMFLPIVAPWDDRQAKVDAVRQAYRDLPPAWNAESEDRIWSQLFDVFDHRTFDATVLPSIKPTITEALLEPASLTFPLADYNPDHLYYSDEDILDVDDEVPELEALRRWSMVLHNQYPWDRSRVALTPVGELADDDVVILFLPKSPDVLRFVRKVKTAAGAQPVARSGGPNVTLSTKQTVPAREPIRPYPAVDVGQRFAIKPKIEALAVVKGEYVCSNDDLIRNAAYSWSPMSAAEISQKTGIEERRYTGRELEEISLDAAKAALAHAGRQPEEIGAVLFCSCTTARLIPSTATWLTGQLGMQQTHSSVDLIAACAGLAYGLSQAVALLQDVNRPVLLVCGEKFSDKIGTVRPSRMIFGDGAAAFVIAPAPPGDPGDIDLLQTYAGGPVSQVNSIIWPNPAFDNNITVYGPEVKTLAGRYLTQMIDELSALPDTTGKADTAWNTVELVVPHQANKTMVIDLAAKAGLSADRLYFNVETMGNTSSASIPIAIADAVVEGVIDRPMWIFAPGFGAGSVAGYAVMRIDPAIIAPSPVAGAEADIAPPAGTSEPVTGDVPNASDQIALAFGS
jgi:3-oxoacyl-(acyl-carrier-protein) synthase III